MAEELLRRASEAMVAVIEAAGAAVISIGALWAAYRFLIDGIRCRNTSTFIPIRLSLGRFLTLGLEFQLAGDILRTAAAPTFAQIGQLAAIATIRTALNYFLRREAEYERREELAEGSGASRRPSNATDPAAAGRGTGGGRR